MTLVMVLLTIAVVAVVAAVATGLISGAMPEPASSIPPRALPNRPLTGQDVNDLRFVQSLRGYRMDQVDAAMDVLAAELDRLRAELQDAESRQRAGTDGPFPANGVAGSNGGVQPADSDVPSGQPQAPQLSYGAFGSGQSREPSWQSERDA